MGEKRTKRRTPTAKLDPQRIGSDPLYTEGLFDMMPGDSDYTDVLSRWTEAEAVAPDRVQQVVQGRQQTESRARAQGDDERTQLMEKLTSAILERFELGDEKTHLFRNVETIRRSEWGFFRYEQWTGFGCLVTAPSKARLLDVLRLWISYFCANDDRSLEDTWQAVVLIDSHQLGVLKWHEFEAHLRGRGLVAWIGRMGSLANDPGEFASELREQFRQDAGKTRKRSNLGAPLRDHEIDAFLNFCWRDQRVQTVS